MEVTMCPACNGIRTEVLGVLGQLKHYRCKACGIEFSERIKVEKRRRYRNAIP